MASLTSARDQLVALKVQLDKTQKEYLALLDANPGADTTAILATIASLNTQITSQKATVRQLSGFQNASAANGFVPAPSSFTDLVLDDIVADTVTANIFTGTIATAAQPNVTSVGILDSLQVSGNVAAGNLSTNAMTATAITASTLAGTLSTSAQPNITSVGTLGALSVTGTASAATVSATTLTGSIGTLANLTVSGNVIATNARIASTTYRTFTKTLGSNVNDNTIICDLTSASAFGFELAVVQSLTGNAIAKYYSGTGQFNSSGGAWKRLIPLSSTGPSSSRDWAVDISIVNSVGSFRLVRTDTTGGGGTTSLVCALKIFNPAGPVVVVDSTESGTDAVNTGFFESTLITQVDGRVGIGTESPLFALDVVGASNVSGNVTAGNVNATAYTGTQLTLTGDASVGNIAATAIGGTLSTAAQPNITSVGTLGSLNVTGDITTSGDITANTIHLNTGIYDSTVLQQGAHIGWNSWIGDGDVDFVNKYGSGTGRGFKFYQSSGNNSTFSTGKELLGTIAPGLTVLPKDVFVANSVGTSSSTAGYRLYIRQLAQPMTWSTSAVIIPQNSDLFAIDVILSNAPYISSTNNTMVWACNGDPGANLNFWVFDAYLVNSTNGSVADNSQPYKVRLACRCTNTDNARVNIFIMFYPI